MKKLVLTFLAMAMIMPAFSQTEGNEQRQPRHRDPSEMVARRTQEMTQKYSLTTEQAEKVKALNEKFMGRPWGRPTGNEGQRPKPSGDQKPSGDNVNQSERRGGPRGMRPNMEEYNKELQTILTDSQYKEYIADMEKRRAERMNNRPNNTK